jgi:hypothetical protein
VLHFLAVTLAMARRNGIAVSYLGVLGEPGGVLLLPFDQLTGVTFDRRIGKVVQDLLAREVAGRELTDS